MVITGKERYNMVRIYKKKDKNVIWAFNELTHALLFISEKENKEEYTIELYDKKFTVKAE